MNDLNTDLIAEARRRVPTLSDAQLIAVPRIFNRIYDGVNKQMTERPRPIQASRATWVSFVELHGGAVVLPIGDGTPYAVYPAPDAPTRQPEAFTGHANQSRPGAAGDENQNAS